MGKTVVLKYGDPPSIEECKDVGEIPVPLQLTMPSSPELQQREKGSVDLVGEDLPDWARARIAVRQLEKRGGNVKARVDKLGIVIVGKGGWEILE